MQSEMVFVLIQMEDVHGFLVARVPLNLGPDGAAKFRREHAASMATFRERPPDRSSADRSSPTT